MDQPAGKQQRQNTDWNVDEEDPAPTIVVGDPASQDRANCRGRDDYDRVQGECRGPFLRGEFIDEYRLRHWRQAAARNALKHTAGQHDAECGRETTEQRGEMARLRAKVENERMAGNDVGWPALF